MNDAIEYDTAIAKADKNYEAAIAKAYKAHYKKLKESLKEPLT